MAVIFTLVTLMITTTLFADISKTDVQGAKDYPLVSRFNGSVIQFYKQTKWDTYKLPVYKDNTKELNFKSPLILEGKIERWQYTTSSDNNPAYIMKNFEKAFKDSSYTILAEGKPGDDMNEGDARFKFTFYGDWYKLNLGKFGSYAAGGEHLADRVKKELVSKYAVKENQLITFGDGQTSPVLSNSNDEGKMKNRRVEIVEK